MRLGNFTKNVSLNRAPIWQAVALDYPMNTNTAAYFDQWQMFCKFGLFYRIGNSQFGYSLLSIFVLGLPLGNLIQSLLIFALKRFWPQISNKKITNALVSYSNCWLFFGTTYLALKPSICICYMVRLYSL